MTGPEHYREAEVALDTAAKAEFDSNLERYNLARAQVHAMLAVAAATALTATVTANRSCAAWTQLWAAIANPTPTDDTANGGDPA
jgi:hypothetical protein